MMMKFMLMMMNNESCDDFDGGDDDDDDVSPTAFVILHILWQNNFCCKLTKLNFTMNSLKIDQLFCIAFNAIDKRWLLI